MTMLILSQFKDDLDGYTERQLRYQAADDIWSIGQMYDHIIVVAEEYADEIKRCLASTEEQPLGKTEFGERLFQAGGFPPMKIRLPDEMNQPPNNTDKRELLERRIDALLSRLERLEPFVRSANPYVKAQHGGFGWLNAQEWYALIEMHTRHHLRQQADLERYLMEADI
ncbi:MULTISPECIES: DinB family protein [Exiguobacterium]|uniref:DinB family protein n=1 Tax=Exiguobacterium TaxID=33986 RepID=UPI001BACAAF1|nr:MULTISPECIES: DinB family protein [Exiguobacterium]MCT4783348.1 DinB family protein [Exiguobacterium himgiriensis]QUE85339.1 DinB family protein [Exiguobacterium alkaliphilum]